MFKQSIPERIKQLRSCMLIHSYIYYKLNMNVISDDQWQRMANELRDLHHTYGEKWEWYDNDFRNWTGATGMHLSIDNWIIDKANYIIKNNEDIKYKSNKNQDIFYY